MAQLFWVAFIKGYSTTAGLIIAIGAQNAFILRQGLIKSHVLVVALLASIIDISMIYLGVKGLGFVIASNHYLMLMTKYGGILFLFFYGFKCFYSALFESNSIEDTHITGKKSLSSTVITLLAMSFLNPHIVSRYNIAYRNNRCTAARKSKSILYCGCKLSFDYLVFFLSIWI